MIRFRLDELLAEKSFKEGRRIEWKEVAEQAGIHRTTLSRLRNIRGYNASMSNLDSLCRYFGCELGDIAVYVPDAELSAPTPLSRRGKAAAAGRPDPARPKPGAGARASRKPAPVARARKARG